MHEQPRGDRRWTRRLHRTAGDSLSPSPDRARGRSRDSYGRERSPSRERALKRKTSKSPSPVKSPDSSIEILDMDVPKPQSRRRMREESPKHKLTILEPPAKRTRLSHKFNYFNQHVEEQEQERHSKTRKPPRSEKESQEYHDLLLAQQLQLEMDSHHRSQWAYSQTDSQRVRVNRSLIPLLGTDPIDWPSRTAAPAHRVQHRAQTPPYVPVDHGTNTTTLEDLPYFAGLGQLNSQTTSTTTSTTNSTTRAEMLAPAPSGTTNTTSEGTQSGLHWLSNSNFSQNNNSSTIQGRQTVRNAPHAPTRQLPVLVPTPRTPALVAPPLEAQSRHSRYRTTTRNQGSQLVDVPELSSPNRMTRDDLVQFLERRAVRQRANAERQDQTRRAPATQPMQNDFDAFGMGGLQAFGTGVVGNRPVHAPAYPGVGRGGRGGRGAQYYRAGGRGQLSARDNLLYRLQFVQRDFTAEDYELLLSLDDSVAKKKTTSDSDISAIPVKQVTKESTLKNDQCSICLDTLLEEGMRIKELRCSHVYHADCIDRWLKCSITCPVCCAEVVGAKSKSDGTPNEKEEQEPKKL